MLIDHGQIQAGGQPQKWQKEEHCKDMEDQAKDKGPGSDPHGHDTCQCFQATEAGGGL